MKKQTKLTGMTEYVKNDEVYQALASISGIKSYTHRIFKIPIYEVMSPNETPRYWGRWKPHFYYDGDILNAYLGADCCPGTCFHYDGDEEFDPSDGKLLLIKKRFFDETLPTDKSELVDYIERELKLKIGIDSTIKKYPRESPYYGNVPGRLTYLEQIGEMSSISGPRLSPPYEFNQFYATRMFGNEKNPTGMRKRFGTRHWVASGFVFPSAYPITVPKKKLGEEVMAIVMPLTIRIK